MTDKKLTDNEIVKALEYCKDCSANLNVEIIDLITRQQSKIDKLKTELKAMRGAANSYKAENDKLKKAKYIFANVDYCADDLDKTLKENEELKSAINGFRGYEDKIKAEAYKEFAEKAKEFMHNKFKALDEYEFEYITERDIDNLVKEMVGDDNA